MASSGALLLWCCVPPHVACIAVVFLASVLLYGKMRWKFLRERGLMTLLDKQTQKSLLDM